MGPELAAPDGSPPPPPPSSPPCLPSARAGAGGGGGAFAASCALPAPEKKRRPPGGAPSLAHALRRALAHLRFVLPRALAASSRALWSARRRGAAALSAAAPRAAPSASSSVSSSASSAPGPPLLHVALGVALALLTTVVAGFAAYYNSPGYYPSRGPDAAGPVPPSVSSYTAARLSESVEHARAGLFVENALVSAFDFPPSLSRKIPVRERYILLTRLQNAQHTRGVVPLRLLILHAVGSTAAGRLAAIASAITYAKNTDRFLLILWDLGRGGEAFGRDPIVPRDAAEKHNIMFVCVDSLQLSPNLTSWSEFQINYYTKTGSGGYSLDSVAALSTRHIFYRAQAKLEGRYAALTPGITMMPDLLLPRSSVQRAWYNFVKHWTFPDLDDGEVGDMLNRVYAVPMLFIDAMSSGSQRLLLRGLAQSTSKRAFFVHAQYGLGNRLRALGSAMAVAKVTGRVLVVIWEPDVHLNCRFSDLFANNLVMIEKLNFNWPPEGNSKDHGMRTVDFYNFMRFQGKHIHNPLKQLVNPRSGRHVYVKTAYVVRSSFAPRIISTTSGFWRVMREELVPNTEIMQLVHDPSFVNIRGMVGVHIRSRTIENDIKGVSEEFYGSGSRTTDHWRRLTGLKTFEQKIMRLSLRYKFFVAADSRDAIRQLERKFGSHRIFSLPREQDCVTRDVECAKLALADILLLSKVPTLLGSNWSSFTEGAVRLSGHVKVLLAGVHFGRARS